VDSRIDHSLRNHRDPLATCTFVYLHAFLTSRPANTKSPPTNLKCCCRSCKNTPSLREIVRTCVYTLITYVPVQYSTVRILTNHLSKALCCVTFAKTSIYYIIVHIIQVETGSTRKVERTRSWLQFNCMLLSSW
jgi:hypothetical protein